MSTFAIKPKSNILAIGAHPDDIELSCGGTLLLLQKKFNCRLYKIVCTNGQLKSDGNGNRVKEQKTVDQMSGTATTFLLDLQDGLLNHDFYLVSALEKIILQVKPSLIFTHDFNDYHQDHIAVSKSTIAATRKNSNSGILFYPSFVGKNIFVSNLYVDISDYFEEKLKILQMFASQKKSPYMNKNFIQIKTMEAGSIINSQYGEKFFIYFSKL